MREPFYLEKKSALREAINHESMLGKKKTLLMESSGMGRTECFTKVKLEDDIPSGKLITALISNKLNPNEPHQTLNGLALNEVTS